MKTLMLVACLLVGACGGPNLGDVVDVQLKDGAPYYMHGGIYGEPQVARQEVDAVGVGPTGKFVYLQCQMILVWKCGDYAGVNRSQVTVTYYTDQNRTWHMDVKAEPRLGICD